MNEISFGDRLIGLRTKIDKIPKGIKTGVGLAAALTALLSGCTPDSSVNKSSTPPTGMEGDPKPTNIVEAPAGFMENIGNHSNIYKIPTTKVAVPTEKGGRNQPSTPEPTPTPITVNVDSKPINSNARVMTVTPTPQPTLIQGEVRVITIHSGDGIGGNSEAKAKSPSVKVVPVTPTPTSELSITTTQSEALVNTKVITIERGQVNDSGNALPPIQANKSENQNSNSVNSLEKNEWNGGVWEPNQTIPISKWWDDMIAKGYIRIDSLAEQYAGDKIRGMLNSLDLVPNPKDYYKTQRAFAGSCFTQLQELATEGQGHITISQEAFDQVPGGKNCDIYANHN